MREERLTGYSIGSRMTRHPKPGPDGQAVVDPETGAPEMMDVIELCFMHQRAEHMVIIPLVTEQVERLKQALSPSPIVAPPPGFRL